MSHSYEIHQLTFSQAEEELEKSISGTAISLEQRTIILRALEFGYSAAFCQKTCEAEGLGSEARAFTTGYEKMKRLVQDPKRQE